MRACVYRSGGQAEGGGQKLDPGGPFITYIVHIDSTKL